MLHSRAYSDNLIGLSEVFNRVLFANFVHVRLTTLLQISRYVLLSMTNAIPGSKSLGNGTKTTLTPYLLL